MAKRANQTLKLTGAAISVLRGTSPLQAAPAGERSRSAAKGVPSPGEVRQVAWFRCFIRGENFPGQLVGEAYSVWFHVTRFVEADEGAAAELAALQGLRAEPKLTLPPGCTPSNQTRVLFDKIEAVSAEQVPAVQPGFVWHPMEGVEAEGGAAADGGA